MKKEILKKYLFEKCYCDDDDIYYTLDIGNISFITNCESETIDGEYEVFIFDLDNKPITDETDFVDLVRILTGIDMIEYIIEDYTEQYKYFLDYEDNWDDENAKKLDIFVWDNMKQYLLILLKHKYILPTNISLCVDGSLDLLFEKDDKKVLINIIEYNLDKIKKIINTFS
jgi:hypothetical protein